MDAPLPRAHSGLEPNHLPPAVSYFCGQLARATGCQLDTVLHAVLCGALAAVGTHVVVAASPVRARPSLAIAEISEDNSTQIRVVGLVAAALNAAAGRNGRRSVGLLDFSWARLPPLLQVCATFSIPLLENFMPSKFSGGGRLGCRFP